MQPKTSPISYPGELPDFDHPVISLRTQLRLSYETYIWLRYLVWSLLLLLGVLLLFLPGGFPPRSFLLFLQALPLTGRLFVLHGPAALFSLGALLIQTLTWLLLWGMFLIACQSLARYTWHLHRSRVFLEASGWKSSLALAQNREQEKKPELVSLEQTASFSATAAWSSPQNQPAVQPPSAVHPAVEVTASTLPRQFVQRTVPLARMPVSSTNNGVFPGGRQADAPPNPLTSGIGVAWDVGLTRKGRPNEDSVLSLRGICNFADRLLPFELHIVADGMGGHANGRLASHLAIRSMLETVVPGLVTCNAVESEQIIDILIDGVHWANQVIYQYGREQGNDMGTTITALLLLDETAYVINVGDSRTYMHRPGVGLNQITRDHSIVARLVEAGAIAPEDIYSHPDRNKVYRGLGDKTDVTVDWFIVSVQPGDVFLLCSDGLWEMVRDPRISDILQTYGNAPALASNVLLQSALQAGGSDNVSLLVVKAQPQS
jgi:serine/threonine protein phosphatase PrpC